jgi:hypothetical protein
MQLRVCALCLALDDAKRRRGATRFEEEVAARRAKDLQRAESRLRAATATAVAARETVAARRSDWCAWRAVIKWRAFVCKQKHK